MDIDRGALVWINDAGGERLPARVVVGPHFSGEFEVVILCELADWEVIEAEGRPDGDDWGEACFPWPVESLELEAMPDDC